MPGMYDDMKWLLKQKHAIFDEKGGILMRIVILLMVLIAMSYSFAFSAEIIEVQLPDLLGTYSNTTRTCEFELDIAPTEVYAVCIRYSGTVSAGSLYCVWPPEDPYPMGLGFMASIRDTISGEWWVADRFTEAESGAFEMTLPFDSLYGREPTWDFLTLGGGTVTCTGYRSPAVGECYYDPSPSATIEGAVLLIEGEFPVATEERTWGRIKALLK